MNSGADRRPASRERTAHASREALRVLIVAEQLRRDAPGGIATYLRGLLRGLSELAEDRSPVSTELWCSRGPRPDLSVPARISALPGPALTRLWDWGVVRFPSRVPVSRRAEEGPTVGHAASLAVPARRRGRPPVTAFVHDLLWRSHPETFPARGRRWHERALQRLYARADRILVPSDATAAGLVGAGFDPALIAVTGEGCDHLPRHARHPSGDGGYLLTVSTLEPRKNLRRLFDAYEQVRPSLPAPWPLKVVGPSGWGDHGVRGGLGIELCGEVTADALARLYAGARAVLYVPLAEGWGLPATEAMRAGAPVLASPMPSTGGAAYEVDPSDVAAIAAGIHAVATDEVVRARLVAAGEARAAALRWVDVGQRHVDAWHALAVGR